MANAPETSSSDQDDSCLIAKLSHYMVLAPSERALISDLEKHERSYGAGEEVFSSGDRAPDLYVVKYGWLYSYIDMPDGRRQIVKLHHPGDFIGFSDIGLDHATTTLRVAGPACLCPFPRLGLKPVFAETPRLAALLFSVAVREQVIFFDMLRAMGRLDARAKISYLLVSLLARLRLTNRTMTDTVRFPLTQTETGDLLGLTNVYVNKTFRAMEEDGDIARVDGRIRVLRERSMIERCDFTDRYSSLDASWFPPPDA